MGWSKPPLISALAASHSVGHPRWVSKVWAAPIGDDPSAMIRRPPRVGHPRWALVVLGNHHRRDPSATTLCWTSDIHVGLPSLWLTPTGGDPSATIHRRPLPQGANKSRNQNQQSEAANKQPATEWLWAAPLLNSVSRVRGKGWHSQPAASARRSQNYY